MADKSSYMRLSVLINEVMSTFVEFYVKIISCVAEQTHTVDAQSFQLGREALRFSLEAYQDNYCGDYISRESVLTYENEATFSAEFDSPCNINETSNKIVMWTEDPEIVGSYSCKAIITFNDTVGNNLRLIIRYNFRIECSFYDINTSLALTSYTLSPSNSRIDISFGLIPQCLGGIITFTMTDGGIEFLHETSGIGYYAEYSDSLTAGNYMFSYEVSLESSTEVKANGTSVINVIKTLPFTKPEFIGVYSLLDFMYSNTVKNITLPATNIPSENITFLVTQNKKSFTAIVYPEMTFSPVFSDRGLFTISITLANTQDLTVKTVYNFYLTVFKG